MEVVGDPLVEGVDAEEVCHHPDDGAALLVGDVIEDLVYFVRNIDRDGDGMGGREGVITNSAIIDQQYQSLEIFHCNCFRITVDICGLVNKLLS